MIERLENIVKEKMSMLNRTVHSYEHVSRVFKVATFLAQKEKANLELVQIGSLLHDIGRAVSEPHNETGAKLANRILKEIECSQEKIEKIVKIILRHTLHLTNKLETLEEKIVWDADKVDLLGVIGITRAFHWGGTTNIPFQTVVKTCFERLEPIYHLLNTQTAKKISKRRHAEMETLLLVLDKELSVTDF